MYLLTYDIANPKRLARIAKICEKYLIRVQKSVFEGDLTPAALHALQTDLQTEIDVESDAVAIYLIPVTSVKKKVMLGIHPTDPYILV